jgi:hypothetical protein
MDSKYITKSELARANGVSPAYISKLFKAGHFTKCMDGKKIKRDCALKTYLEIKDPTRDSQREANRSAKISPAKKSKKKDEIKKEDKPKPTIKEIEQVTNKNIKEDDELYNQDNLAELELLLVSATTGNQKVQIIKDFWTGKINQQKYLEGEKLLIPKDQIIKDVQRILKAFRDKALALPTKISGDLVGLKDKKDVAVVVESYMYELLEELSSLDDVE